MQKILILTSYFEPDLSAGSFRMRALVEALNELAPEAVTFDLFTTMPNRYHQFSKIAKKHEKLEKVNVFRYALPKHKNGFADQAKAYRHFYRWAKEKAANEKYSLVFATSSRLFTAYLGSQIAKKQGCPLYLDIRDIFVDTMSNILNKKLKLCLLPIFKQIEKHTLKCASHLNVVSEGFVDYFKNKTNKHCKISVIPNGIDNFFLENNFQKENFTEKLKIVYAGNIGEGQGLHKIIPALAKRSSDIAEFEIIGAGGQLALLEQACSTLKNVSCLPPVNREKLLEHYKSADVLFLHLNNYDAFKRVLPSKIFEYAATNKPILAGVAGTAEVFLNKNVTDAWVFNPCDTEEARQLILAIKNKNALPIDREDFCQKFGRVTLSRKLAIAVLNTVQQ